MNSHTCAIIVLVIIEVASAGGEIVCQPGGLATSTKCKAESIEFYYEEIINELVMIAKYFLFRDSIGDIPPVDWDPNVDTIIDGIGLFNLKDHNNISYWGDRRPEQLIDVLVPNYFTSNSFIHYINTTHAELVPVTSNITEFCAIYNPVGTYQPFYCRNPAHFNHSMLNYDLASNFALKGIIKSVRETREQYLSTYTSSARGTFIYSPPIDIGDKLGVDE